MREFILVTSDKRKVISSFGYRNLIAWEKADQLAHRVYEVTETFPKTELFGLTSQLRRAALSVPANIVEGYARANKKEFHRFLGISLGSLAEVGYFIDFSSKRRMISQRDYEGLHDLVEECGRIVWKLYKSQQ